MPFMSDRIMKSLLKKVTRIMVKTSFLVVLLALAATPASATTIDQYASTVLDFSSQYSTFNWGAVQALGAPDIFVYGENPNAWAPLPMDGTLEYISLGFATPVFADGLTIRETLGSGFVYQVDILDTVDIWHTVWSGFDPSPRPDPTWNDTNGTISNFLVSFFETPYLVDGVRIHTNTDSILGRWEEIDSVTLHGTIPEGRTAVLLAFGLLSLAFFRLRRQRQEPKD